MAAHVTDTVFLGQVLLVSSKKDPSSWLVPGGGVEVGEEMTTAAMREAWEEAGVQGHITRYLGLFEVSYCHNCLMVSISTINFFFSSVVSSLKKRTAVMIVFKALWLTCSGPSSVREPPSNMFRGSPGHIQRMHTHSNLVQLCAKDFIKTNTHTVYR